MFHLFLHLVLLVPSAYCSKQYHTSGSSGPYAFALAFGAPYFPSSQELEVDGHRRLELLSTKFLAVHFLDPGVPVENSAIDVESEFNGMSGVADIHKAMHLRHTGESGVPIATNELCVPDPVPSVAEMPSTNPHQRDLGSSYGPCLLKEPRNRDHCPPIIPGKLNNVKILRSVDMGPQWSLYELPFCDSRVVVFGNWEEDIHRILEVMIKFGHITYAWAIEDLHYSRSNVYFFEYQSYRDAQTAVSDARYSFHGRVGIALCEDKFYRRSTRLKIIYEPGCSHIDEYLSFSFLESNFGYVVELSNRRNEGNAYLCFNWAADAKKAHDFFQSRHYVVKR